METSPDPTPLAAVIDRSRLAFQQEHGYLPPTSSGLRDIGLDPDMTVEELRAALNIAKRVQSCEWDQATMYAGHQLLRWLVTGDLAELDKDDTPAGGDTAGEHLVVVFEHLPPPADNFTR